uniref:Ubiquitin-like domain-containing protein n=1 Tax=Coturnix japonica TaxID=93934 RepID=A0A8C2T0Y2_COTJA
MIRRHKTTIFTDAKESSTVLELKRIVEGILKRPPEEQRLYKVGPMGSMGSIGSYWVHGVL